MSKYSKKLGEKLEIISHRGYWKDDSEKNTKIAFQRSFKLGFGTETDVRDMGSQILISHDIPKGKELRLEDFFEIYKDSRCEGSIALNIKSDGLQNEVKKIIKNYDIGNYFVFDMSIPDTLKYVDEKIPVYVRVSEYEQPTIELLNISCGLWFDYFKKDNEKMKLLEEATFLIGSKKICVVSPELHKKTPESFWNDIKNAKNVNLNNLILCTDFPERAQEYFKTGAL